MNVIFKNIIDTLEKNITGNSNYSFDEIDYIKEWYYENALGSLNVLINYLEKESIRCKNNGMESVYNTEQLFISIYKNFRSKSLKPLDK